MSNKKIFITSTGRTGSKFIHHLLSRARFDVGLHERRIGEDGAIITFGWNRFITTDQFAPNEKVHGPLELWNQVALVREPISCITSLQTLRHNNGPDKFKFFEERLKSSGELRTNTLYKSMMFYYCINNWLFELWDKKMIDGFIRIEDLPNRDTIDTLVKLLHTDVKTNRVDKSPLEISTLTTELLTHHNFLDEKYKKKLNTRFNPKAPATWESMAELDEELTRDIRQLAYNMGYKNI